MTDVLSLVHALHRSIETGTHGAEMQTRFTHDAVTVERPNLISPTGRASGLEQMAAASETGSKLLSEQKFDVFSEMVVDETAIVRLTWTGTVAVDAGPFHAGQQLTAHVAQFVTASDGRISRIETYDCYEPFDQE
jgi:SnoaL-like domain